MRGLAHLFLGFRGRIGRRAFWVGIATVLVLGSALGLPFGVPLVDGPQGALASIASLLIGLASLYPTAALSTKRLHDRDQSGRRTALLVVPSGLATVADAVGFRDPDSFGLAGWVAVLALLVIFLAFAVELGFRRGSRGDNRYGPPPGRRTDLAA